MSDELKTALVRYYDFLTAYQNWLRGVSSKAAYSAHVGEKSLGYPEEIRRLNAALDFSMPDAQNKNQKTGGKYHESFGQYQCV